MGAVESGICSRACADANTQLEVGPLSWFDALAEEGEDEQLDELRAVVELLRLAFPFRGHVLQPWRRAVTSFQVKQVLLLLSGAPPDQQPWEQPGMASMCKGCTAQAPPGYGRFEVLTVETFGAAVIKPCTTQLQCSFAELLNGMPAEPQYFVSHRWGSARILPVLRAISGHVELRALGFDATYWLALFASRPGAEPGDGVEHVQQALNATEGLLLVTDADDLRSPFSRLWCLFELANAFSPQSVCSERTGGSHSMKFDIAVARLDDVALLLEGLGEIERQLETREWPRGQGIRAKLSREASLPLAPLVKGLSLDIKHAEVSNPADKSVLLSALGGPADVTGHTLHLRAALAARMWRQAAERGLEASLALPIALSEDLSLRALEFDLRGCHRIGLKSMLALAGALPPSLHVLHVDMALCARLSSAAVAGFAQGLARLQELLELDVRFCGCAALGGAGLASIAAAMPSTLIRLSIDCRGCVGVGDGGLAAIVESIKPRLQSLSLGLGESTTDAGMKVIAHCLSPELRKLSVSLAFDSSITDVGLAALAKGLPQTVCSLSLNLRWSGRLGDGGVAAVAGALLSGLRELDLDLVGTCVTQGGIAALARRLPPGLEALRLEAFQREPQHNSGPPAAAALQKYMPLQLKSLQLKLGGLVFASPESLQRWRSSVDVAVPAVELPSLAAAAAALPPVKPAFAASASLEAAEAELEELGSVEDEQQEISAHERDALELAGALKLECGRWPTEACLGQEVPAVD